MAIGLRCRTSGCTESYSIYYRLNWISARFGFTRKILFQFVINEKSVMLTKGWVMDACVCLCGCLAKIGMHSYCSEWMLQNIYRLLKKQYKPKAKSKICLWREGEINAKIQRDQAVDLITLMLSQTWGVNLIRIDEWMSVKSKIHQIL